MADKKFWMVLVGDDDPVCIGINSEEELQKAIRTRVLEAVEPLWAFVFDGEKLKIQNPLASCTVTGAGVNMEIKGVGAGQADDDLFVPMRYVRDVATREAPDDVPPPEDSDGE